MMFHEERLLQLTKMFMEGLRCVEESVWQGEAPVPHYEEHFQRIQRSVIERMMDHREKYIRQLLWELKEVKQQLDAANEEHQASLNKLKELYQEELDRSCSRSRKRNVEVEVKKHIELRMKELEENYILKVVHEQELVKLRGMPCSRCESLRLELKQLEEQNLSLRKEVWRNQQECNDEITRQTEVKSRNFNDSKANAGGDEQAEIIYENDEAYEETSRKGSHYCSRKPELAIDNSIAFNTSGSFQQAFSKGRASKPSDLSCMEDGDLQSELQSIRKNLRERHNRLMRSSKASWRPEGLNLNQSELNESAIQPALPTLKRNQSTINFKLFSREDTDEEPGRQRHLTKALSRESKRFDTIRSKPLLGQPIVKKNQVQSPEDSQQPKPFLREQTSHRKPQSKPVRPVYPASPKDKPTYTFKYLNLKM